MPILLALFLILCEDACAMKNRKSNDGLWETADGQGGFFTARQAIAAGFADNTHPYHVRVGNWLRECRGVYRLARYPQHDNAQLILWALWARNLRGCPQGVYSHLTALRIHDLSDVMPVRLEMTVPPTFRRRTPIPSVLVLHRGTLAESDILRRSGYAVTTPLRSVLDLVSSESISRDIIRQAIREARHRGLITAAEFTQAADRGDIPPWAYETPGKSSS
jgi:predicted transcriptional regulator of viral defense system